MGSEQVRKLAIITSKLTEATGMEKKCARCNNSWITEEGDPFITCPQCRIPAKKKKKQGGSHVGRSRQGNNAYTYNNDPGFDNAIRATEEDR